MVRKNLIILVGSWNAAQHFLRERNISVYDKRLKLISDVRHVHVLKGFELGPSDEIHYLHDAGLIRELPYIRALIGSRFRPPHR